MRKVNRVVVGYAVLLATVVSLTPSSSTHACSVCLCGDDLFFYLGEPVLVRSRLEFTVQEQYMSKSSGPTASHDDAASAAVSPAGLAHGDADLVKLREHRLSFRASYRVNKALSAFVKVPLVIRHFTSITDDVAERESSSGVGDIEFSSILSGEVISRPTASYTASAIFGVKTPSGQNDKLLSDGDRLDEHLQAGTGSWGGQVGAVLARTSTMYSMYSSGYIRTTGENDYAYKYGTSYLYNFGFMYRATSLMALTTEINGRYAKRDQLESEPLHNTGGSAVYLTPGVRWLLGQQVNLTASLRVPVIERLNEDQDEGLVFVAELGLRR